MEGGGGGSNGYSIRVQSGSSMTTGTYGAAVFPNTQTLQATLWIALSHSVFCLAVHAKPQTITYACHCNWEIRDPGPAAFCLDSSLT